MRLLLVEDDDDTAFMYKQRLERDEYQVDVAADAEQALRRARRVAYDLIYLDIRRPQLDGFAVLEKLRTRAANRHTPVVILSDLGQEELRARGRRLGTLEFLIKSKATLDELARAVGTLSRRSGTRSSFSRYPQAG